MFDQVQYVTSLEEVLWGIALVGITMVIHGYGMLATLLVCQAVKRDGDGPKSLSRGGAVVILASWMIVLVHLLEVFVWAMFFLWEKAMPTPSESYHFALMQYTTVGSTLTLPFRWRLLEGMLPIAGLMTFAWSTGVLFTLAQEFQNAQLKLIRTRLAERKARARQRASHGRN